MHLEVYRHRPDVRAVVHAHPPTATGFAVAGIPLDRAVLAEVITTLGSIPIAEYATPSTEELPAAVRKYVKAHDGLLLANHGALALAGDVFAAYYRMETIEHFANISLVARTLGREHLLSRTRSGSTAGAPRHVRHRVAGADLHRRRRWRRAGRRQLDCQVVQAPDDAGRAAGARYVPALPSGGAIRQGRGDSANIPGTDGADRGRGTALNRL